MDAGKNQSVTLPVAFTATTRTKVWACWSVGTSLAAATSLCVGSCAHPLAVGTSVTIVGTLWARWMLRPKRDGWRNRNLDWLSAIPAAMTSAVFAVVLAFWPSNLRHGVSNAVFASTFGAFVYLPAMVAALAIFGLPIERARAAETQGIDAAERAHGVLGLVSSALAILAWLFRDNVSRSGSVLSLAFGVSDGVRGPPPSDTVGFFAMLGLASSLVVIAVVLSRAWDRVDFLRKLEAGPANGFRVETRSGSTVVLEAAHEAADYRAADDEQAVMELDGDGRFVRRL
ncbi:MAG: hypothetical protein ACHREM_12360 [Polyangiales bacterium]